MYYIKTTIKHKTQSFKLALTGLVCFRLDDNFQTFERFRNSLMLNCDEGDAGILEVTPNITWPDVVYYQVLHAFTPT